MLAVVAMCCATGVQGQNMYVAVNLPDYFNFGTINGEFGLSPWPKWTLYARGRYNPFTFNINGRQLQNRVAAGAVGARYWFWYSGSGWFVNSHFSYSRFNTAGIINTYAYEGDAYSVSGGGGYSLMLSGKLNMDFALGVQGGYAGYKKYACPKCGREVAREKKVFVAPSNLLVQLSLIL